jgi:hypothetical protein
LLKGSVYGHRNREGEDRARRVIAMSQPALKISININTENATIAWREGDTVVDTETQNTCINRTARSPMLFEWRWEGEGGQKTTEHASLTLVK